MGVYVWLRSSISHAEGVLFYLLSPISYLLTSISQLPAQGLPSPFSFRGSQFAPRNSTFQYLPAEAVSFCGARPVFVDIDERTYTMDPGLVERAITPRTRAIIPVHLFGQVADMDPVLEVAARHGIPVVEDACQAHGAEYKGRKAGTLGVTGCFSFYPGKNLGAFGEAGGIVTNDEALKNKLCVLRDHGQARKYFHTVVRWNARMDGIQGAVLNVKLKGLAAANEARRRHAQHYNRLLSTLTSDLRPLPSALRPPPSALRPPPSGSSSLDVGRSMLDVRCPPAGSSSQLLAPSTGSHFAPRTSNFQSSVSHAEGVPSLDVRCSPASSSPEASPSPDPNPNLNSNSYLLSPISYLLSPNFELRSPHSRLALRPDWINLMFVLPEERPGAIPERGIPEQRAAAESPVTERNPLEVNGWDELVSDFPEATPFHSVGWLRVLSETYRHQPLYLCQFSGNRLAACLPLAEAHSPVTGTRGVSLPFTDCVPALSSRQEEVAAIWDSALALGRRRRWKYVECRSSGIAPAASPASLEFYSHSLDLRPGEAALLTQLDSSVRRALRKAQSSGLKIEFSSEPAAMEEYYRLHSLTRRRQGVPPQPWRFFENLGRHLIARRQGMVVTARHEDRPVASAVFLHFGEHAIYKFGASDLSAQQVRPNNLVMWEAIRYYAVREFRTFDFGRTSLANEGLRRFKRSFGAQESRLAYHRYHLATGRFVVGHDRADTALNRVFRLLPLPALRLAGRLLYPHLA